MHSCTALFAARLREPQQQLACLSAKPGHTSVGHNTVPQNLAARPAGTCEACTAMAYTHLPACPLHSMHEAHLCFQCFIFDEV